MKTITTTVKMFVVAKVEMKRVSAASKHARKKITVTPMKRSLVKPEARMAFNASSSCPGNALLICRSV